MEILNYTKYKKVRKILNTYSHFSILYTNFKEYIYYADLKFLSGSNQKLAYACVFGTIYTCRLSSKLIFKNKLKEDVCNRNASFVFLWEFECIDRAIFL